MRSKVSAMINVYLLLLDSQVTRKLQPILAKQLWDSPARMIISRKYCHRNWYRLRYSFYDMTWYTLGWVSICVYCFLLATDVSDWWNVISFFWYYCLINNAILRSKSAILMEFPLFVSRKVVHIFRAKLRRTSMCQDVLDVHVKPRYNRKSDRGSL